MKRRVLGDEEQRAKLSSGRADSGRPQRVSPVGERLPAADQFAAHRGDVEDLLLVCYLAAMAPKPLPVHRRDGVDAILDDLIEHQALVQVAARVAGGPATRFPMTLDQPPTGLDLDVACQRPDETVEILRVERVDKLSNDVAGVAHPALAVAASRSASTVSRTAHPAR